MTSSFANYVALLRVIVLAAFMGVIASSPSLHAQRVTRVNPSHLTLRGVSMASLQTAMIVGDSNYVAVTHNALTDNTWSSLQSGLPRSVMLYAVAYAGDTLHTVIAGSQGAVAWTSDGGASWHTVSIGTTASIRALTWNLQGILVGVGDGGLVIRSTDLGQTWQTFASPTNVQLNAISFGTPNDATAVGNDTTIIQTHDAGQTWTTMKFPYDFHTWFSGYFDSLIKDNNFTGVAMRGTDSVWLGIEYFTTAVLVNRGAIDTANEPASRDQVILFPKTHHTSLLYVGMPNFMDLVSFTSSDYFIYNRGQQNWSAAPQSVIGDADGTRDPTPLRFNASAIWKQDTTVEILGVGDELTAFSYIWTPHSFGHEAPFGLGTSTLVAGRGTEANFLDVNILPNGYGYAIGTQTDLERTTDSGRTWNRLTVPIVHAGVTYDSSFDGVLTFDTSTALIVGWDGLIYEVTSTGGHFVSSGTDEKLRGIALPSEDTGILVGDYGTVLRTTDRGATWDTVNTPTPEFLYSVAFSNPEMGVAVGSTAEILRTTDAGKTWSEINNVLLNSLPIPDIRQVQAFPDGTCFARAGTTMIGSKDFGQNWQFVNLPPLGDTDGMSFYSSEIGIVAGALTSSALVGDTAHLAYTTDGGGTWKEFIVLMWATNRIVFQWLSDHEVLLFGTNGFIVDVDLSGSDVRVSRVEATGHRAALSVYPNPSSGDVRVEYTTTTTSGPVTIDMIDEASRTISTFFHGEETMGDHARTLLLQKGLYGAYFVRIVADGTSSTAPISIQ